MGIAFYATTVALYYLLNRKLKMPAYFMLIALLVLSIVLFFPGVPQDDSNFIFGNFNSGKYNDWQPPLYSIWWHIVPARWFEFIMNTLVYYSGLIYISFVLHKKNKKWQNDLLILFSFYPLYFMQIIILLKDVPQTGFLIISVCMLMVMQITERFRKQVIAYISMFVVLFLCQGFKYNGLFAIIPLLAYGSYLLINGLDVHKQLSMKLNNKLICSTLATIGAFAIIMYGNKIVTYSLFETEHSYSPAIVMFNDLANIQCASGDDVVPDSLLISSDSKDIMCNPYFINYYNYEPLYVPEWGGTQNPAVFQYAYYYTDTQFNLLKSAWEKAVVEHLPEYFSYRWKFLYNDIMHQWWWTPLNPEANNSTLQTTFASIAVDERKIMAQFNGLFILLGTIISLILSIKNRHNKLSLVVSLSSLAQLIGLYLLLGNASARYFFWDYIAILLSISLLDNITKKDIIINETSKSKKIKLKTK